MKTTKCRVHEVTQINTRLNQYKPSEPKCGVLRRETVKDATNKLTKSLRNGRDAERCVTTNELVKKTKTKSRVVGRKEK